MALGLFSSQLRKRNHAVAIDLGMRATKAVFLQRSGQGFDLAQYTVQEAPASGEGFSAEVLGEHLKKVMEALGAKVKQLDLVIGSHECLLRQADVPMAPVSDLRSLFKYNSKSYLQQDLSDYIFDCYILPILLEKGEERSNAGNKCRVLVGGARKQYVEDLQTAAKQAGFTLATVSPALVGPANALEFAYPEMFAKEVVALVDIGFRQTSISIVQHGELSLNRVVSIGGDKLTAGLAGALNISYPEAEGIKIGMAEEVQNSMLPLLSPLGRELRASIDFFEHQQDKTVSQVMISGGSARSAFIIENLQSELMVPCKCWNPVNSFNLALPAQKMAEIEQTAPQLAVAVGGALAALN
jgi:type IV pilus assembly protein PilM